MSLRCRSGRRSVILALALLWVGPLHLRAQQKWPTTDWNVICYDPPVELWANGPVTPDQLAAFREYKTEIGIFVHGGDCDDSQPGTEAARMARQLKAVSEWLQGQRFRPPNVPLLDGRYQAALIPHLQSVCYRGACVAKRSNYFYDGSNTPQENATNPNILVIAPQADGEERELAHELFHAVQHSYAPFQSLTGGVPGWILEGTAEAVGLSWFSRNKGDRPYRERDYSERLDRKVDPIEYPEYYDDEVFWRAVSREYADQETYGFLIRLFEKDLGGDAVAALDSTFREEFKEELADVYTEVVANHLDEDRFYAAPKTHALDLPREIADREAILKALKPLATNAYRVRASVPPGESAELRIAFEEDGYYREHGEDLHLVVDDQRYDQPASDDEKRNVFRQTLPGQAEPHELLVRVTNVPPDPTDPKEREERSYTLKLSLGEVEPCDPDVMIAATGDAIMASPVVLDPETAGLQPGSASTLSFSGLVADNGAACTHHVSAVDFMGAMMAGGMDEGKRDEIAATMMARAEAIQRQLEQPDMRKYESMSEEELQNLPPKEKQKIVEMAMGARDMLRAPAEDMEEVVLNLYSPHIQTWQFGMLGFPQATGHGGLGGWSANAAANLVIRLPGTTPREIREGETYPAAALGLGIGAERPATATLSGIGGFYTRWEGELREIPGSRPRPESVAQCEQGNKQLRQMMEQLPSAGAAAPPQLDCAAGDMAFQGTLQVLSGEITGTVTVDAITGAGVRGTFELSGTGTLHVEESVFTHDDQGRVNGQQSSSRERRGPVTIRGTFTAPNHTEGLPRFGGYRSVVIQ